MRTRRARRLEHQPLEHDILRLLLIAAHPRHVVRDVPDHGVPATTRYGWRIGIAGDVASVVKLAVVLRLLRVRALPRGEADVVGTGQAVAILLFRSDGRSRCQDDCT
jgi:hypothetical protein